MQLSAIKNEIEKLSPEERQQLADGMETVEEAEWDRQIARDFAADGAAQKILADVQQQVSEGKAPPLEEGLAVGRAHRSDR